MKLRIYHCLVAHGQWQPRDLLLFTAALFTHLWTDSGHFEFISQAKVGQVQSEHSPPFSGSELIEVAAEAYVWKCKTFFGSPVHACFQFEMNAMSVNRLLLLLLL